MRSEAAVWLEQLPKESFFRSKDVPAVSRGAAHSFLQREMAKEVPTVLRAAPNLYWKPRSPSRFSGRVFGPSWTLIGLEVAGPGAAALGWFGANKVGWSDQLAFQYVEFAVPGEPAQRNPHRRVTIRPRRNLTRRALTHLEATYLEAVIGFDRWCEIEWDHALEVVTFRQRIRAERGIALPRAEVLEMVASQERPRKNPALFRSRVTDLVAALKEPIPPSPKLHKQP